MKLCTWSAEPDNIFDAREERIRINCLQNYSYPTPFFDAREETIRINSVYKTTVILHPTVLLTREETIRTRINSVYNIQNYSYSTVLRCS